MREKPTSNSLRGAHLGGADLSDANLSKADGIADRMIDKSKAWQTSGSLWAYPPLDADVDDCDREDDNPNEEATAAGDGGMKEQPWHRRHAIQLAGQVPESKEDALAILDAARRLVTLPGFWDGEPEKKSAAVVRIGG